MEDVSRLEENLEKLLNQMTHLRGLRDKERRMDWWLLNVEKKEQEVDDILKELKEIKPSFFSNTIPIRQKLNQKVISNLKSVKLLIEKADDISDSIGIFMSEVAIGKALRFSYYQLKTYYTSNSETHIGSGEFADVYKGRLPNGVQVAIKVFTGGVTDEMEKQFMAEVGTVSKTYHRNLVKLYGFCFDAKLKALVYEYMEGGSLEKSFHLIGWDKLYDIAIGTARGLAYLHEHCYDRIIHRDIKAGNVLLDSNYVPKVADFGLAKFYSLDKSRATTKFQRERVYDAPEVHMGMKLTCKCDVYSYGIMLFDVLRRKLVSSESEKMFPRQVWEKFEKQKLDEIFITCSIQEKDKEGIKTLCIIALWCIHNLPPNRPSMSTVVKVLEGEMQLPSPRYPFPPSRGGSSKTGAQPTSKVSPATDQRAPWKSSSNSSSSTVKTQTVAIKKKLVRTTKKKISVADSDSEWDTDSS